MEWIPAVFIVFKVVVLGLGMFFAIKWHYDQGKKGKGAVKRRAVLRASAIVAAVFVLLLAGLLLLTFGLGTMLGLDLTSP
jgi:amino acid transporter